MQFVSMEVNRLGSSDPLRLEGLSQGLNAICGPNGSGKTTLLNWLRQIAGEHSPASPWSGRSHSMRATQHGKVEIRNQHNTYQLTQTADGQLACHIAGSGFDRTGYLSNAAAALSAEQQRAFSDLTSIHHSVDNISRLETLATQLGLDQPGVNHAAAERQALLSRQNEIHTRLRALEGLRSTREGLLSRRGQLEAELHRVQRESQTHRGYGLLGDRERLEDQRSALATELRDVRAELAALERDIASHKTGWPLRRSHQGLDIGSTYREQLEKLDARLDRWRQTLRDLRAHRERLEHDATDARLDKQIGDQLSITKTAEPRAALRSLEAQLLAASQQLDALIDRNDRTYESYHAQTSLPESLRNMQRDLYEVCQQLARQESTTAAETLRQQATQLARSEAELLQSVEKLIDERAALLRKIADEYHLSMDQLTLAFGDWCECHDHPHLSQWLLNEAPGEHSRLHSELGAREISSEQTQVGEQRRVALQNRLAELQSQLQEIESQVALRRQPQSLRSEADVARDLDKVIVELRDLEERDRLRVELDEIRRSLAKLPVETVAVDPFRQRVNKHLDGLLGATRAGLVDHRYARDFGRSNADVSNRLYESVIHNATNYNGAKSLPFNGRQHGSPAASSGMTELAMRLAVAEALLERGQPISLLIDGPLDHAAPDLQQSAVRYLEAVAATGQQIVLFSSDERIAELVRSARGWVGYMRDRRAARPATKPTYSVQRSTYDVNRQLLGFANDHEADKWYEPSVPQQRMIRRTHGASTDHRLTEISLIEDCPTLDATCAARSRALGIDRVGDLLATDPHWLAEHLRLNGVTSSTVMRWQAEAKLLCNVPQLRPFDARVLAGAGVRHPRQLAEMHPSQLLERVERFLATDRGRDILRSGNSYELSRITAWIASAKSGDVRGRTYVPANGRPMRSSPEAGSYFDELPQAAVSYRQPYDSPAEFAYDADHEVDYNADLPTATRSTRDAAPVPRTHSDENDFERRRPRRPERTTTRANARTATATYPLVSREYEPRELQADREPRRREAPAAVHAPQQARKPRQAASEVARVTTANVKNGRQAGAANGWRYYLDLSSPVVDAPSIGPRVAEKLATVGIETVEEFLATTPESLAASLETKRIDGATVHEWQDQARLVCRIPNLRGHDAQLLVACKVTSPEELARMSAAHLLAQVTAVAKSPEGQRMLRGSQAPDLAEVADWINWSTNSRSLNAA